MTNTSTPAAAPMTTPVLGPEAYAARQAARRERAVFVDRGEVMRRYQELSRGWNAGR